MSLPPHGGEEVRSPQVAGGHGPSLSPGPAAQSLLLSLLGSTCVLPARDLSPLPPGFHQSAAGMASPCHSLPEIPPTPAGAPVPGTLPDGSPA